jgi:hypothetical protein
MSRYLVLSYKFYLRKISASASDDLINVKRRENCDASIM